MKLVKETRDGRGFGNKIETRTSRLKREGRQVVRIERDAWEGPGSYDLGDPRYSESGQYVRQTWEEYL